MSVLSIDIHTEHDSIHVYTSENMIPNESYVLRGHVELNLKRPTRARQITLQFKGTICNVLSNDPSIYHHNKDVITEEDVDRWPASNMCFQPNKSANDNSNNNTSFLERVGRYALYSVSGYTTAYQKIVREGVDILTSPITLPQGVNCLPFEIHIPGRDLLPTLLLPRHSIHYALRAEVHFASFKEKYITFRKLKHVKPIHVSCHVFPSLQILELQPRVRYMGSREGHMRYEVSIPKYVCLQQQRIMLSCHFFPLRPDAYPSVVEVILEQTEVYPLRSGRIRHDAPLPFHRMIAQSHKLTRIVHSINRTDTIDHLPFVLDLTSPHIAQDVDAVSLKVTHKIKVIVHFTGHGIRKMGLRFPLVIGTIPSPTALDLAHQDQENDWLNMIRQEQPHRCDSEENNGEKLPTYFEVLREGPPPAAFVDGDFV